MVIDDSADNCMLLETLLKSHGWDVYAVGNGAEALTLLKELSRLPDLILLDIQMPVMNGLQFRMEQERDERIKAIPVIVMSGCTDKDEIDQLQADGVLSKPLEIRTLVERVAAFL